MCFSAGDKAIPETIEWSVCDPLGFCCNGCVSLQETKPFKKPVGGVSMFGGGVGPLAELRKRTASQTQSDDASPTSETSSEFVWQAPASSGDSSSCNSWGFLFVCLFLPRN